MTATEVRPKFSPKRVAALLLASPPTIFLLAFFLLPGILLFIASFWESRAFAMVPGATIKNYAYALHSAGFYQSTWVGLQNGLWTAALSTVVSGPIAFYIVYKSRSNALLYLALVSWFSSYLVRVYAWRTILGTNGIINTGLQALGLSTGPLEWRVFSRFAVVLTLVHIMLPFTLLLLVSGLRDIKKEYLEAAYDLGASTFQTLSRVVIPMAHKSIVGSFMFTFVLAASDYVTPQLLGGRDATTTGLLISNQFRSAGNWPLGSAMAFLLLVSFLAVYAILTITLRIARLAPGRRYHSQID
jgi:spermidine/putrescine transport system permease protein